MAIDSLWNPRDQYDLDPATGQYAPAPPGQLAPASGTNWDDIEKQLRAVGGNLYDPSDLEGIKRNTSYTDAAGNSTGVSLEQALASQRSIYDQRRQPSTPYPQQPQQATAQYSSSSQSNAGDAALSQFMQMLQSQQQQQAQQQAAMREILMGQLGSATQPISENSPGIREVLAGQRLGLQRGAERERRNAAELRAYDGSGGLGGKAFDTDVRGILEHQGEADAQMTGQVMNQQLQRQEDKIQRLLTLAMQLGDAESARTLQAQLNAIQSQMQQGQFYSGLGQQQNQFLDQMGFNYANLNSNNNLQTLMALLNAA